MYEGLADSLQVLQAPADEDGNCSLALYCVRSLKIKRQVLSDAFNSFALLGCSAACDTIQWGVMWSHIKMGFF